MNARMPAVQAAAASSVASGPGHGGRSAEKPALAMVQAEDAVRPGPAGRSRRVCDRSQVAHVPQGLGPDDDPRRPVGDGAAGIVGRRHAGVEPDRQPERGDRPDDRAVIAGARDGVEVRHVAGVRAEALAEAASELDRVRRGGQHALDRRVGMALALAPRAPPRRP